MDALQGGRTVHGDWPDQIDTIVFMGIRKNAHTHLLNTIGDLRQRLGGASSVMYRYVRDIRKIMKDVYKQQKKHREWKQAGNSHNTSVPLVFAVLRDPVERFLSASCQDLAQEGMLGQVQKYCQSDLENTTQLVRFVGMCSENLQQSASS